jgi:hypothetical protein
MTWISSRWLDRLEALEPRGVDRVHAARSRIRGGPPGLPHNLVGRARKKTGVREIEAFIYPSIERAGPEKYAPEHQEAKERKEAGHNERQVPGPVGLNALQLADVFPMLNGGDDKRKGADADECKSRVARVQYGHCALRLYRLQDLVDGKPEGDHGERRSNPSHEVAFGGEPRAVYRQ